MSSELWRWIPEYEGYYLISNKGNIVSLPRTATRKDTGTELSIEGRTMALQYNENGYRIIRLTKESTGKSFLVHRLVAKAFIPNPENLPEVNHIDGRHDNNCVENLEWVTSSQNKLHLWRVLRIRDDESPLTEEQIIRIREDTRPQSVIAAEYGVVQQTISEIQTGNSYRRFAGPRRKSIRILTEEQVRDIRSSQRTGKALADEYGVSQSLISSVRTRKTYKDVK